jgi:calcium-dependent protein kinase
LREGLLEEIKVMRKLKHSNIVELYDVLNTSSNYYLVQEYCDQGDLQKMLKLRKSLPDREILGLIADLVSGFTELIKQGVVHRDLKPANILVNKGKFKLADFGFAKCVENF